MPSKLVKITKGFYAIVDDCLFDEISKYKWHYMKGYAYRRGRTGEKKAVSMHRHILKYNGLLDVDHVNGNGLDNMMSNLRICRHSDNCKNRRKNVNNKSGYKGVVWNKKDKRWVAQIRLDKKTKYLGGFKSIIEVAVSYNNAAKINFNQFSNLNKIYE